MMRTSRLDPGEGGQHLLLARRPGRPGDLLPAAVQHERGGRPQHADPADQVEVVLGVDLDVGDTGDGGRDVGQHPSGRAAGRAEGGAELQQRGPLTELVLRRDQRLDRGSRRRLPLGAGDRGVPVNRPSAYARQSPTATTSPRLASRIQAPVVM